ncbi:MAG: alpha-hydroxy acid oxidase [Candidatus Dormibacteria bacterium]
MSTARDPLRGAFRLDDLEALAEAVIPPDAFGYIAGGSGDELALAANRAGFRRWRLLPRALAGIAEVDTRTRMLGLDLAAPILLSPTALNGLAHPEGECAVARAAARFGTVSCLSTLSSRALEEVAAAAPTAPRWFQLYIYRDREVTRDLVDRAVAAGFSAIAVTVDALEIGRRARDQRSGFAMPQSAYGSLARYAGQGIMSEGDRLGGSLDPTLSWADLDWVASVARLPVLVKGLVRADEVQPALDHGAAGLVVSNHGGRQVDQSVSAVEALGPVARAAAGRLAVLVDGGVRSGGDVVTALALGADAVMIGRPCIYALALGGEEGVLAALQLLQEELRHLMLLCGAATIGEIDAGLLQEVNNHGG